MTNPYLDLTVAFNDGRRRALVSSGQAVVLHRLAITSKDGDWVLREDEDAVRHVLQVLAGRGARYRFGAPLDLRWLAGGWSAHLEHQGEGLRVRTDFVTRPPRVSDAELHRLWRDADAAGLDVAPAVPVIPLGTLARIKMSLREKDYPIIGELARRMDAPRAALRYSRSSRDLLGLAADHPDLVRELQSERPVLGAIASGRVALETALDRERRELIRADEARMAGYRTAAERWASAWPAVSSEIAGLPLPDAHRIVVARAEGLLPVGPSDGGHNA